MNSENRQKERDYLEVFQEVTRLISMVHDPQRVMDLVVRRLPALMDASAATIRLLDAGTNTFVLGAAWGLSDEYLSRATIDSHEVMARLLEGRPTAREDIGHSSDAEYRACVSREGVKSALSLPIVYKERVIGLLRLLTRETRMFSEAETAFAMALAEQVGIAISNSHMVQEMENRLTFFGELRKISKLVNSTLDLDRILSAIVEKLPVVIGVKGCTIRLLHPATNRLDLVAAFGLSKKYLGRGSISREDSVFKVLKGEPVAVYDAESDPRVDYHEAIQREGIKSLLAVPIRNDREIIGVLRLLSTEHRFFSAGETQFALAVAEEGGNAIEKARTYRKISLLFKQIEEQERFLQTLLDSLWMQLVVVDPDKRVVMVNRRFLEANQMTEKETLGRFYHEVCPWKNPEDASCPIEAVLFNQLPKTVVRQLDGNAGPIWFEHHLSPMIDADGKICYIIEAVQEITDQKLLEGEKMARMKLEGVIEMAGTAAHELNSPLFAALGTAQLLGDDLGSSEMKNEMETIIRNLKKMGDLIREMTAATGFESRDYVGDTRIVALKKGQT